MGVFCQARHCGAFIQNYMHPPSKEKKLFLMAVQYISSSILHVTQKKADCFKQRYNNYSHGYQFLHPEKALDSGGVLKLIQELTNIFPHRGKQLPHVKKQLEGIKCMTAPKLPAESSKVILTL